MAVQAFSYLEISDGTLTATFQSGGVPTDFQLVKSQWSPSISSLKPDWLVGRSPYFDAVEEMSLLITETSSPTAALALANLQKLMRLQDHAARFWKGEQFNPVTIKFVPKGSTINTTANPLQGLLLPLDKPTLPKDFQRVGDDFIISPVKIRFARVPGAWIGDDQSVTVTSQPNGAVWSVNMVAALSYPGPTKIDLTNFYLGNFHKRGYLIISDRVNNIVMAEAETYPATEWTSVTDAGKLPSGSNVLRFTPTGTSEKRTAAINIAALLNSDIRKLQVFANVRNNSASATYMLRAHLIISASITPMVETPWTVIPPSTGPLWYPLGVLSLDDINVADLQLIGKALTVNGTLDIDQIAMVDVTSRQTYVIAIHDPVTTISFSNTLTIDPRILTRPFGQVYMSTSFFPSYEGDIYMHTMGQTIYGVLLKTGGETAPDRWRMEAASAVVNNNITITRLIPYLSPE